VKLKLDPARSLWAHAGVNLVCIPLHNVAISILQTPAKYSLFTKGCQYPWTKSGRQPANIRIRSKKILKSSVWVIKHKNEVRTKKDIDLISNTDRSIA